MTAYARPNDPRMARERRGQGPVRAAAGLRLALPLAKGNFRPQKTTKWEAFVTPRPQKTVLPAAAKPLITLKKAPDDSGALCYWKRGDYSPLICPPLALSYALIWCVCPKLYLIRCGFCYTIETTNLCYSLSQARSCLVSNYLLLISESLA